MAVEADRQRNEGAAPRSAPTSPLRAPQEPALGPGLRGAATAATVVLLLAGGVLRVVLAILHHGVIWPDETYQMTEAAHRVVFGYGIVPWEFQQGLRSWIGPGFLVPPTALAGVLGLDGMHVVILVKAWVALWATGGAVAPRAGGCRLYALVGLIVYKRPHSARLRGQSTCHGFPWETDRTPCSASLSCDSAGSLWT